MSSLYSFPNGSSLRDIGFAIGVLNEFFRLRFSAHFFPPHYHVFNKVVKNRIEEEKKEDK